MSESVADGATYAGSRQDVLALLELLPCMAFLVSEGRITAQNQLAAEQTGLDLAEPVGFEQGFLGAFPTAVPEASGTEATAFECILLRRDELPIPIRGAVRSIGTDLRLIVALERAGEVLPSGGPIFGDLLNAAPEAMAITYDGRLLHVNREFSRLFGYEPAACIGHDIDSLLLPEGRLHENEILFREVATEGRAAIETVRHTSERAEIAVSLLVAPVRLSESATGLFHTFRDIRRQKEQEARLQYSAMHDPLTGLPNRALFLDRLRLTLARLQRRPDRLFAVMFLDIDNFKHVNDTFGHAGGDALLLEVTRRLHECLRPQDTVARYGGDEFAVLLDEAGNCDDIARVADRIQAAVQKPAVLEEEAVTVSVSIGITVVTPSYQRAEDVVRAADLAMYMAKVNGKAQYAFAPAPLGGGATIHPCPASARSQQPA
jgi:diguanylate cyclase (GGDEF)-like protein/PAS domain S-box-containing protein